MLRSLYTKLALVLLALFLLVAIFMVFVTRYATTMYQQEVNQKLNFDVAKHVVADLDLMRNNTINQDALKNAFHQLMVFNPSIEIYLLDTQGEILSYSAEPGKVKRPHVSLAPIKRFLAAKPHGPLLGDDPRDRARKKVFTVHPITDGDKLQGYLYVILGGEEYDNVIDMLATSYILNLTTWLIVAGSLFSLAAGLLVFAWLTGRLRQLSNAMALFRQGASLERLTAQVPYRSHPGDEIDQLNNTFLEMAKRIDSYIQELRRVDTLRRDLVANVSHDLRTPLATLQGYVETLLLKKQQLNESEQQHYLHIALQHCLRLNKLVQELFELAKLDAKETMIKTEPFNLPELIQDVVQKFHLRATEKGIALRSQVPEKMPFIKGDIAMIERVLENLIENALRHTPQGGNIEVKVRPQGSVIAVELSDTGIGIPQEELPYIFDRFYKGDKSRTQESASSGLGLAITKRMLELHDSNIEVKSDLNQGTTFSFELPIYTPA